LPTQAASPDLRKLLTDGVNDSLSACGKPQCLPESDVGIDHLSTSYAGKLVTVLGKGGGVSVTVRADHASIEG
jgi:hypothetical protein